jgi:hypothetical protein
VNKVHNIDKNRATTICRSFFIALIFAGSSFFGISQETTMYHFQRKGSLEKIILPGEKFNSTDFLISFPDSIFSAGNITIKNLTINDWKFQVNFVFSENTYTKLTYSVKKKNCEGFMKYLENSNSSFEWNQRIEKRKYIFTLSSKTQ